MVYGRTPIWKLGASSCDGRAILLGEILDQNNERWDIHLKGSGLTPFSRNGDGKAALGPILREYLMSEAMYKLGIPTTLALFIAKTGENVYRESISWSYHY